MRKLSALSKIIIPVLAVIYLSPALAQSDSAIKQATQAPASINNAHLNIHKDPNCGCCSAWVKQLPSSFSTSVFNTDNVSIIKDKFKVPSQLRSCHTAVSDAGFVFEGHIPNQAIKAFLSNPPQASFGLAVPGMPVGSPGMEYKDKTMRYPIYLLNKDGSHSIYAYATGSEVER